MLSLPALLARSLRLPTTPTLPSFPSAFGISTRRELSSLETGRASTSTTFRRKEKEEEHSTSTSTATPRSMASPSDVDLSEMDSDGYKSTNPFAASSPSSLSSPSSSTLPPSPSALPSQHQPTPVLSSFPTRISLSARPSIPRSNPFNPSARPTLAHFAAPESRTVFADDDDRQQWKWLVHAVRTKAKKPAVWEDGDAFEVKMKKGWEWQRTPPDISPVESTPPTPYTFSSDPYLYTPTAAHFADPASRTVFASAVERSAWLSLRRDVKKGWLSPTWRVNDEECVKMQKGWEKMRDKRKRREDKRVVILKNRNRT
ncbi:hypothetical protein BDY24DRAFT_399192 [Mrakia frigida]|uniref:uncharacterized protein n=1 Tax=Mrakia frigida TaxID=29902 RepID=UPI003FCBFB09